MTWGHAAVRAEVMSRCARLEIAEPPWMDDEAIGERVEANRAEWPGRSKVAVAVDDNHGQIGRASCRERVCLYV